MSSDWVREIYAFPSGELRAEHYAAFADALAQLWVGRGDPAAVVFARRGEPVEPPATLGARAYDERGVQGVLSYVSAADLLANVRPLFLNTEPELFLLHREDFTHVALRADEYAQRELRPKDRGVEAWLRRVQESALARQYGPIAALAADGRCFAVEAAS
jgi:hypothetical protein